MIGKRNSSFPAVLLACLSLVACQGSDPILGPDGTPLPDGTVQTGENTFMIPLQEKDADGCQGYRMHAPGRLVAQVIYYRQASGEFTVNKMDVACYASNETKD